VKPSAAKNLILVMTSFWEEYLGDDGPNLPCTKQKTPQFELRSFVFVGQQSLDGDAQVEKSCRYLESFTIFVNQK
jgi:hypothetical protein